MIKKVKVKDIRPNPFQARKTSEPEAIKSLAEEIRKVGLWAGALRGREQNGHVELCFGHRRLDAVKVIGWKEVEVDVVALTDEEMALQALVENLQREGLNDADKGDGMKAYIKLRMESSKDSIRVESIRKELCSLLGLSEGRVLALLQIAGFDEPAKKVIRERKIAGTTAAEAHRIGGSEAVKVAAEKKLSAHTVQGIGQKVREIKDEAIRSRVKEEFVKGKVTTPEEVVKKARQLEGRKKKDDAPPDLLLVIGNWTVQIKQWNEQLDQVIRYLAYIDSVPQVAEKFRDAVKELIARLEKFI